MLGLTLFLMLAGKKPPEAPPLMIQTVAVEPKLPIASFGSWYVQSRGTWADSWTSNGSGSDLGLSCGKSCVLYVMNTTTCDKGDVYPALIALASGVDAVTLKCYLVGTRFAIGMTMTDEWFARLKKEGTLGIAMGMKDGSFKVSRFQLTGVSAAIGKLNELEKARGDDGTQAADFSI